MLNLDQPFISYGGELRPVKQPNWRAYAWAACAGLLLAALAI